MAVEAPVRILLSRATAFSCDSFLLGSLKLILFLATQETSLGNSLRLRARTSSPPPSSKTSTPPAAAAQETWSTTTPSDRRLRARARTSSRRRCARSRSLTTRAEVCHDHHHITFGICEECRTNHRRCLLQVVPPMPTSPPPKKRSKERRSGSRRLN